MNACSTCVAYGCFSFQKFLGMMANSRNATHSQTYPSSRDLHAVRRPPRRVSKVNIVHSTQVQVGAAVIAVSTRWHNRKQEAVHHDHPRRLCPHTRGNPAINIQQQQRSRLSVDKGKLRDRRETARRSIFLRNTHIKSCINPFTADPVEALYFAILV